MLRAEDLTHDERLRNAWAGGIFRWRDEAHLIALLEAWPHGRTPGDDGGSMTVIAYSSKHKILAADSRCSDAAGMHITNCQKIFRLSNGSLLGTAGDSDDRDVRDLLAKSSPRKMPTRGQLAELKGQFSGIIVFPKGHVFTVDIWHREFDHEGEWAAGVDSIRDEIVAVGCGAQFAYGAMEAGATPIEAVRAACRRDTACALPVQWEHLDVATKKARRA
jgi:hypothetical protein